MHLIGLFSSCDRHVDDRERIYVEYGKRATWRLIHQLDRLVEALRIQERADNLKLTAVDVGTLLATVQDDNLDEAMQRGVALRVARTCARVVSDALLLESILGNLVRNALKYTHAGGRVLVGCRRRGPHFRLEVHDTGVGIPDHNLLRIFEAFRRFDSDSSGGLGLGLFVVQRAADLLGHTVEVQSKVGYGSCFSVLANAATDEGMLLPSR